MTKTKLLKMLAHARDYASDIEADDLLHYAGLERRPTIFTRALGAIGIFGAGLVVGAGVGLLFSPMAPEEARRRISTGAKSVKDTMSKEISHLVSHEEELAESKLEGKTTRESRARNGATGSSPS